MDFSPLKLPTDNLYKFLTLAGLISFLFSISVPFFVTRDLEVEAIALARDAKILEQQTAKLSEDAAKFEQQTGREAKEWEKEISALANKTESEKEIVREKQKSWSEGIKKKSAALEEAIQHTEETITRIEALLAQIEVRQRDLDRILSYWPIGFWGGLTTAIIGFAAWYWQVQRHLDRALRLQADALSHADD